MFCEDIMPSPCSHCDNIEDLNDLYECSKCDSMVCNECWDDSGEFEDFCKRCADNQREYNGKVGHCFTKDDQYFMIVRDEDCQYRAVNLSTGECGYEFESVEDLLDNYGKWLSSLSEPIISERKEGKEDEQD